MLNQYPTSNQEREILALTANGIIQAPRYADLRTDCVVRERDLSLGVLSVVYGNAKEIAAITEWLNANGFDAASRDGRVIY